MFKEFGNIASLVKQAQQMGAKMEGLNQRLKGQQVTGTSGGGMVQVDANGLGEVLRISIESSLVERGDREMIEDLIPAAVNQAIAKAKQLHAEEMKEMAQGMNVPGLNEALGQIAGRVPES